MKNLCSRGHVLVVDDGSDSRYTPIFEKIRTFDHCTVITNGENIGKGRAIKNGLHYILQHFQHVQGVLTVGAHGQHDLEDVDLLLAQQKVFSDGIILGVRQFDFGHISKLHTLQNLAATILFELFFRKRLIDTQTGLRFIPYNELSWLKNVYGDSFNYDTNMLVQAIKREVPIYEVPIGQVKIRKNSIVQYDELIHGRKVVEKMWIAYLKNR